MAGNFQVLYAPYAIATLGAYTSSPEIFPYLQERRERGLFAFSVDEARNHSYKVVGTILAQSPRSAERHFTTHDPCKRQARGYWPEDSTTVVLQMV